MLVFDQILFLDFKRISDRIGCCLFQRSEVARKICRSAAFTGDACLPDDHRECQFDPIVCWMLLRQELQKKALFVGKLEKLKFYSKKF